MFRWSVLIEASLYSRVVFMSLAETGRYLFYRAGSHRPFS